jgi:tetratricopeptide (TPR) repeat protein
MLAEARAHWRAGRTHTAEEAFRRLIRGWPLDPEPRHSLGVLCAQSGRLDEAIEHMLEAARLAPGHVGVSNHLGHAYLAAGRVDEAAQAYGHAIGLRPELAEGHYNLGTLLRQQGDLAEAAASYRRAIAADPAAPHAHIDLGVTLQQMAMLDDAVAEFRQAIAIDAGSFAAHYNLAGALAAQRQPEAAAEAYRAAIRINPREPWAEVNLGVVLKGLDRHEEAIQHFRRAIAIAPDHAAAHVNLGGTLYEKGDHAGAVAALRRAFLLDPKNPGPYVNLAQAHQDAGDFASAETAYRQALRLEPGLVLAQAHFAILLQRLGKLDEARMLLDYSKLLTRSVIEAAEGWPTVAAFNAELARSIYDHPTLLRDPPGKATTNGSQTAEILDATVGPIAALRRLIEAEVTRYLAGVVAQAPELFGPPPVGWSLHGWGVVLRSNGYQTPHFHPAGIVSGVYYVRVPEAVRSSRDGEAGFIRLGQPEMPRLGTRLPQADLTTSIKPAEGLMILFPSYFWHNTVPFESDEDRICIAFDVLPQRFSAIPA